ncbi:hypothetical protein O181_004329 [Austropuccinia psidii MF-1]|uniref:Uncharacterized protein n=1 Tax=Austropuccinia psidii MF-1 TaxID=1389203 RepID=A0A9Q3BG07_9BASI|nr:hypothetical protein [Austropuccinia psidii MF-1]
MEKRKVQNSNQLPPGINHQVEYRSKRLEKIGQLLEKLQISGNLPQVNVASDSKELSLPSGSDYKAFIFEEVNAMVVKKCCGLIYLDSSSRRTVFNYLSLLEDPTPSKKKINTFPNPIKVTHLGTLLLNGVKLYPV